MLLECITAMLTIFCWLFYLFYWRQYKNTPSSQLTSEVEVIHKASTEAELGTQCTTVWCLSKSVHALSMECYDWISYRFPNLKKKKTSVFIPILFMQRFSRLELAGYF